MSEPRRPIAIHRAETHGACGHKDGEDVCERRRDHVGVHAGRDYNSGYFRVWGSPSPPMPLIAPSIPGVPRPISALELLDAETHAREYHEHGSCEACIRFLHLFILERRAMRSNINRSSYNEQLPPLRLEK